MTDGIIQEATPRKSPRKMVGLRMSDEDYNYLSKMLGFAGISMSSAATDVMIGLAQMFRSVFGDDIEQIESAKQEFYLRNMVRLGLLEMAKALNLEGTVTPVTKGSRKK